MENLLKTEIFKLNMIYHQMRVAGDMINHYDKNNDPEHKIRDVLEEAYHASEKCYDEQNEIVEKLIKLTILQHLE